jgi:hypothetical protein
MIKKFFRVTYSEKGGDTREKYLMLEKKPNPQKKFESSFAFEISNPNPLIGFGEIYGGMMGRPYGGFLPKEAKVDEITVEEFLNNLREAVDKNYVNKKTLKDLFETWKLAEPPKTK